MSFYDDARQKVRQQKQSVQKDKEVSENTKTGYTRKTQQRSKKQKNARNHG